MKGSRASRLFLTTFLIFCILLFTTFLINIPDLHKTQGLPFIPALIAAEAMLLGISLCAYGVYAILLKHSLGRRRLERSRLRNTELPWAHNPQWVRKEVTHSAMSAALFLWFFALNWWAFLVFTAQDRGKQLINEILEIQILYGVLVLIGVFTVWTAIRKTVEWLTYGRSVLEIETLPGRPGESFRGAVETGFRPRNGKPIHIGLTGFTRHWSRHSYIPHEEERQVTDVRSAAPFLEIEKVANSDRLTDRDRGAVIPVQFEIPRDVPSSGLIDDDMEVIWKVHVRATRPDGSDFLAEFHIPIYAY